MMAGRWSARLPVRLICVALLMDIANAFIGSAARHPGFRSSPLACKSVKAVLMQPRVSTGLGRRRADVSQCRMSATAADGDQLLAKSAAALGDGQFQEAGDLLDQARKIYAEVNVDDRDELIIQIAQRVAEGKAAAASSPSQRDPGSAVSSSAIARSKLDGDKKMAEATSALGRRDLVGAIQLLDEAAELFRQAGFAVAKDREPVLGNLRSSVLIEIERDELAAKRARKKAAEEAEEKRLLGLGEAVVAAAMYGSMPADDQGIDDALEGQDVCIVVDNGSSRASSTVALRKVATRLEERMGGLLKVLPASLRHSNKASLEELGGQPATLLEDLMTSGELAGADSVTVLPLFLGPSRAVLKSIPQAAATAQEMGVECTVAGHVGKGDEGVAMLAKAMLGEVERVTKEQGLDGPSVIVVDHGSPSRDVTRLRDDVADAMRRVAVTSGLATSVTAASMERGEGDEFAFADPLLAACLPKIAGQSKQGVVVCLMFISPGTHAGPGGDIDQIIQGALAENEGAKVYRTRLLGECDTLIDILEYRISQAGQA